MTEEHDPVFSSAQPAAPSAVLPTLPIAKGASTEFCSPELAALTRPPKVGDEIEHEGRTAVITGTKVRGPGDFSVIIDSGETLHSRSR